MEIIKSEEYKIWISEIKEKISSAQIKASLAVNTEMLNLYWDLGQIIFEKLSVSNWGTKVVENISKDLQNSFPNLEGFSKRNLMFMKQWVEFYQNANNKHVEIVKQLVSQFPMNQNQPENIKLIASLIPWGHNILIIQKIQNIEEAIFYIIKTIENNWSRAVLGFQIESQLYERQGKAITNFKLTLPKTQSDLANETLKDPYKFDFLTLTEKANERDIENQLIQHITKFLLELGTGFAFIGRQYLLKVGENEYKIDLLFYHIRLRCFIVVELKSVEFKSEFTGKLSFYLSAVDDLLRKESDNPTIGILLCKSKNKVEAEYALRGISQPIGVAEYQLSKAMPENLKSQLPTIPDIEEELNK
jgi:predicted nuclease of restriction endonuclease-like (RecB) superfamily